MTELRKQINNIVEDHQACLTLAKSMNGNEVYEGTTATAEDVVIGKTAYSNGALIEGTLDVGDELVISLNEPAEQKKLWYRKSKNLTDKSQWTDGGINNTTGNYDNTYSNFQQNKRSPFIPVSPNTSYTFSIDRTIAYVTEKMLAIGQYSHNVAASGYFLGIERAYADSVTITTKENTKYIICYGYNITQANSVQLEKGTEATGHEAYVSPLLFRLNANNVYEEV